MFGVRRETFPCQAALDAYFETRGVKALLQFPPLGVGDQVQNFCKGSRPYCDHVTQHSALQSDGMYVELPSNATAGSPSVTIYQNRTHLTSYLTPLQAKRIQRHSSWLMSPDRTECFCDIHLDQQRTAVLLRHPLRSAEDVSETAPGSDADQRPVKANQAMQGCLSQDADFPSSDVGRAHAQARGSPEQAEDSSQVSSGSRQEPSCGEAASSLTEGDAVRTVEDHPGQIPHQPSLSCGTDTRQQQLPAGAVLQKAHSSQAAAGVNVPVATASPAAKPPANPIRILESRRADISEQGLELDGNPAEAARKAALRVQRSILVSSSQHVSMEDSDREWLWIFQRQILSEGMASSLSVIPESTWLLPLLHALFPTSSSVQVQVYPL